jgi:pyruvate,water dikinase
MQRLKALEAEKQGDMDKAAYHKRIINAVDHFSVELSVGVQQMARSDLACSGVIFTLDTDSGFRDVVYITGTWGLGEYVVQGTVNPDQFYVFKPTAKMGYNAVIDKKLGDKDVKLVYRKQEGTVEQGVAPEDQIKFILSDEEVVQLAKWATHIEEHYGRAMDIEWAKDGITGNLYIVQARPETVHEIKTVNVLRTYKLTEPLSEDDIILVGEAVGNMIGQGVANVIEDVSRLNEFKPGEVLVTEQTNPDWEPAMRIAEALITDRGGRTSHAAIVSRELGLPCIIGTPNATKVLKDDDEITVDCSEGIGRVLQGLKKFEIEETNLAEMPDTKTQVMMNLGVPDSAFVYGQLPHHGVGLARLEFIINDHIQFHPKALIDYPRFKQTVELIDGMYKGEKGQEKLKDLRELVRLIEEKTPSYENKTDYFVDKLAQGIARIGAAFYPYDVIVRLSDFKTNEYANLIGGEFYEPHESNPMIGWRGASRYYAPDFKDAFALECKALFKVRNTMGLKNVKAMVPFCRTPEEGRNVIKVMGENGLVQGEDGLEVYVMAEIPSNVILAEEFADVFDGFSIGSNDLTQLTLGLDRDSELVAHIFDERDEAVKRLLERVIKVANEKGKKIGICGQAPSDFPSIAAFIVEAGINSMSLNPDTIIATRGLVYITEWALNNGRKLEDLTDEEILNVPGLPRDLAEEVVRMINMERQHS